MDMRSNSNRSRAKRTCSAGNDVELQHDRYLRPLRGYLRASISSNIMINRKASARWSGDLKQGKGSLSTGSGTLNDTQFAFGSRFESGTGTNPEELIGAALAGCFTMALSSSLSNAGHVPDEVRTEAKVSMDKVDDKMTITSIHLETTGRVAGVDQATFDDLVERTREGCIISRVLDTKITVNAKLLQGTSA